MKGKCLVKLSETDRATLERSNPEGEETSVGVTMADDTDDEEEEVEETVDAAPEPKPKPEPEPEPEPEPAPPVKKKVVRKKAVATAGA